MISDSNQNCMKNVWKMSEKWQYEPFGCDGATEKLFASRLWSGGVGDDCWWSDVIISAPSPATFLPPTPTELLLLLVPREEFCSAPLLRDKPELERCGAFDGLDWLNVLRVLSMIMPSSHLVGWKIPENENARKIRENQKWNGLTFYLEMRRLDSQFPS